MSHRLTLLRHGLSEGNDQGLRQGQKDFPLTDNGRRQVQALADRWLSEGASFDLMISSPLDRALESAQVIQRALQVEMETDDRWMERSAGLAEGQPVQPDGRSTASGLRVLAHQPLFEQGESQLDLHLRAVAALQAVLRRPSGSYLIVSHGGILGAALSALLGLTPTGAVPPISFSFSNTGFAVLAYLPDRGHWRVERLNDTCHLRGVS